mmetsp:Transcript_5978/g.17286  ORF Transcript_5978/g.17286 Transcript_5978/m.17286 type:complete len:112 (-) Transcript_5978:930-1265(-)
MVRSIPTAAASAGVSSSRRTLIPESWENQLDSTPPPLTSIGQERRLADMSSVPSMRTTRQCRICGRCGFRREIPRRRRNCWPRRSWRDDDDKRWGERLMKEGIYNDGDKKK